MRLPFSEEQFLDLFVRYNELLWPAALGLWLASAAMAVVWIRSRRLVDGRRWERALAALLALHWLWAAVAYHLLFFVRINPAAYLFAALFLLQSALLVSWGLVRRRFSFRPPSRGWMLVGAMLVVYSLVYPAVNVAIGFDYPRMPTFGVPCPTTLFTAGMLLAASADLPRFLLAVPLAWCLVGGSAALLFGVYADWALLVTAPLLILRGAVGWEGPSRGGD